MKTCNAKDITIMIIYKALGSNNKCLIFLSFLIFFTSCSHIRERKNSRIIANTESGYIIEGYGSIYKNGSFKTIHYRNDHREVTDLNRAFSLFSESSELRTRYNLIKKDILFKISTDSDYYIPQGLVDRISYDLALLSVSYDMPVTLLMQKFHETKIFGMGLFMFHRLVNYIDWHKDSVGGVFDIVGLFKLSLKYDVPQQQVNEIALEYATRFTGLSGKDIEAAGERVSHDFFPFNYHAPRTNLKALKRVSTSWTKWLEFLRSEEVIDFAAKEGAQKHIIPMVEMSLKYNLSPSIVILDMVKLYQDKSYLDLGLNQQDFINLLWAKYKGASNEFMNDLVGKKTSKSAAMAKEIEEKKMIRKKIEQYLEKNPKLNRKFYLKKEGRRIGIEEKLEVITDLVYKHGLSYKKTVRRYVKFKTSRSPLFFLRKSIELKMEPFETERIVQKIEQFVQEELVIKRGRSVNPHELVEGVMRLYQQNDITLEFLFEQIKHFSLVSEDSLIALLRRIIDIKEQIISRQYFTQYQDDSKFIFDVFHEQAKRRREVFSGQFVDSLKMEDSILPPRRLFNFKITNSSNEIIGYFGLFDGVETDGVKNENLLPVERKYPNLLLKERAQGKRVFEVRRLALSSKQTHRYNLNLYSISNELAQFLQKNGISDGVLIAHTDELGSKLFKKSIGFEIVNSKEIDPNTRLLKMDVKKFMEIHSPQNNKNCLSLIKRFLN